MIRNVARILGVTSVALLAAAGPVAYAAPSAPALAPNPSVPASTAELFIDGAVELDAEILALVALGAFGDDPPPELVAVHDEWAEFLDGLDRQGLIDWAIDADRSGADVLTELTRAGFTPSPAIQRALGPLSQGDLDLLAAGQPLPGDPLLYVRARGHLDQGLQGVPPASELPGATPASVPVVTAPIDRADHRAGPVGNRDDEHP